MAEIVRSLAVRVGVDMDSASFKKAEKSVEKVKESLNKLKESAGTGEVSAGMSKVIETVASIFKGPLGIVVAAASAAAGLGYLANKFAEAASAVSKTSQKIGINTGSFQELSFAAKMSDVDVGQMTAGVGQLSRSMYSAGQGNQEAIKSFASFGIAIKGADGKLRPTTEVIADLADKFHHMPDGAEKTALAMKVFGRSGAEMIPMLNKGGKELREFGEDAHMYGLVIGESGLKMAEKFDEVKKRVSANLEGLKLAIGETILPSLLDMANSMKKTLEDQRDLQDFLSGRASLRGKEAAEKLGPEAADRYMRNVVFGKMLAKAGTGEVGEPLPPPQPGSKLAAIAAPPTAEETKAAKERAFGTDMFAKDRQNIAWVNYNMARFNNLLTRGVNTVADKHERGWAPLQPTDLKQYELPRLVTQLPSRPGVSEENYYVPYQTPEKMFGGKPSAKGDFGHFNDYLRAQYGPTAPLPPQGPAWSEGPKIENTVNVSVASTEKVNPQEIAKVVSEAVDTKMRESVMSLPNMSSE